MKSKNIYSKVISEMMFNYFLNSKINLIHSIKNYDFCESDFRLNSKGITFEKLVIEFQNYFLTSKPDYRRWAY
ncbi:hypothetical protein RIR_jg7578.t1 [Rhizophagus irregularis DAOM 181602=DAOM 197198]|nr:hypothetical protein RIR_jg7578.t1 [Rhizophagus irregularis DAOM 181602=DAOM 197198]